MKRALLLVLVVFACGAGFLSVRGTLPFIPIFGSSMEPTLQSGGLLMVEPIETQEVEVGDIIVFTVPEMVREFYNYPQTVAHRVIEVRTVPSLGFRTKGDNTGEDPFTVRPQDIRGTVGDQIPYLGLPLLFFQSTQGLAFVIIALVLLAIFLYWRELSRGGGWLHRGIFSPIITEERRTTRILTHKIASTEEKVGATEAALEKFAAAVGEYAYHLSSHTSAIQGLAEASHELKASAAEQNRVIAPIMENFVKEDERRRMAPPAELEGAYPPLEKETEAALRYRELYPEEAEIPESEEEAGPEYPPGCAMNREERYAEALAAEKEILTALDRLHRRLDKSERHT